MRQERIIQASIFDVFAAHEIGRELKAISQWLDEHRRVLGVVSRARQAKLEDGAMVRIDSTVTQALMHAPTDSSLLWDAVRVMVRLLAQASTLPGAPAIAWRNHRRLAKTRALAIQHSHGKDQ